MRIGLAIFSRLDSSRLPGKALRDVAGRTLLGRVVDRCRRLEQWLPVVVATSDRPVDDPIVAFTRAEGVEVFRGSAEDTLARAVSCARAFGFDAVVRICGDSPFIPPEVALRLAERMWEGGIDIATNVFPRSFPRGASAEVITTAALERILAATDDPEDREHATAFAYRHPERFRIWNLESEVVYLDEVHLAVDTAEDLRRAVWIAERLESRAVTAELDEVVTFARAWPERRSTSRQPLFTREGQ